MILLVLSGCTGRGRYIAMRNGLDSLNQLNCTGQPLTTADVQPYVDFFNFYGNSNDQLLVHYLLGRAYHEHGEAPMALQSYQEAALRADATSADCDKNRTNNNGTANGRVSLGCLLIKAQQMTNFEKHVGRNSFKVILRRK